MKRLLLTSASLLALMTAAQTASATTFLYSGAIVDFTIPATGTYQITAFGAQGGSAGGGEIGLAHGGGGAEIRGDFVLTKGDVLQIAVGGAGDASADGGGGGGGG
ncbi:MAG: hypothetical protein JO136_17885, partial [Hyphomicrobiales bacterium]|nr:hypothetical protein [Hyphomicrobiales bacterium]